jgi:hypothetical protein
MNANHKFKYVDISHLTMTSYTTGPFESQYDALPLDCQARCPYTTTGGGRLAVRTTAGHRPRGADSGDRITRAWIKNPMAAAYHRHGRATGSVLLDAGPIHSAAAKSPGRVKCPI